MSQKKAPKPDPLRQHWEKVRADLMMRAMQASTRANSWRNYNVGCAALVFDSKNPDESKRWAIFTGANVKVSQDSRPICAEMVAVLAAIHAGYDTVVGLAVFGEPQEDHGSGIKPKHIHPCEHCRATLSALPIMRPTTRILCVKAEPLETGQGQNLSNEEMPFEELLEIHANGNGHGK